jgi:hypothetical protein
MFSNLGLHVILNPAGTFSFVGSIPMALATMVPATAADVMAGRAVTGPDGAILAPKFPVFPTRDAAVAFAASKGFTVRPVAS